MHRFLIVTGCALLFLAHPAHAAPKPKPPAISACYQTLCLDYLRWRSPDSGVSLSAIEGVLVNSANVTLSNVSLGFALTSGRNLVTTANASFSGDIPPGGRWSFSARFLAYDGRIVITKSESVSLSASVNKGGATGWLSQTLQFDPLFAPIDSSEQKQWEKIHGKRQR